ncbi:MAG: AtpZ/AtpI family protein [Clostridiales bacterium]|jgi:F0F1-type ATP synthase assembly protein I|nr:AtpZ/AtpI family protein [Clostridiales bacterium]
MKLKDKDKREIRSAMGLLTHIGLTMTISILGCLFLGKFLDEKLGTSPWLMFVFILLGVASALFSLYKIGSKKL